MLGLEKSDVMFGDAIVKCFRPDVGLAAAYDFKNTFTTSGQFVITKV